MLPLLLTCALLSQPPTRIAILDLMPSDAPEEGLDLTILPSDFRDAIPALQADRADIVVIRASGTGPFDSGVQLARILHDDFAPRFRTVAWLDHATGGACLSVWSLPELYCTPDADFGFCTLAARGCAKPGVLEHALAQADELSRLGSRSPLIMRSMMTMTPLSADILRGGHVTFHENTTGAILLNAPERILFLDAQTANRLDIVQAIAADQADLATAMHVDNPEWVGAQARRALAAAREAHRLRNTAVRECLLRYQQARDIAADPSIPTPRRLTSITSARECSSTLESLLKDHPATTITILGLHPDRLSNWLTDSREELAKLESSLVLPSATRP